jgi:hypothetical protein
MSGALLAVPEVARDCYHNRVVRCSAMKRKLCVSAVTVIATTAVASIVGVSSANAFESTCYDGGLGGCYLQTQNGNAPLYNKYDQVIEYLPLNDKVFVKCYYWLYGAIEDHVTWENIPDPLPGHIPDIYINIGGSDPSSLGIPQC